MNNMIEFASSKLNTYLTREIATGNARSAWNNIYAALPNPDPVLRKTGQSITILDEIRRETHVASCAESREAAVTKKKWCVERINATPKAMEVIEGVFNRLPIRQIIREICEAWGYGFAVSEIIWERQGDLLLPKSVIGKPRSWFHFDREGRLCLRNSAHDFQGTPVDDYKFLLTQFRASYDNPYGESKFSSCFWPVTFKKGGLKFWAVFLEKFGMPHIVGKLPRGAEDKERNALLQALFDIARDAVSVIPDDSSIETQDANVSGSTDAFEKFAAYHDGEISTAILGHSAGATATPGRLGGEDMAAQVRGDIVDNDAAMVESSLNSLITYIYELNPSLGVEPPVFQLFDPKDIDKPRAERDTMLLNTGKVKLSKKYFIEKYDFAEDEIEIVEDNFNSDQNDDDIGFPQFAAPKKVGGVGKRPASNAPAISADRCQESIDILADGVTADEFQECAEVLLHPVQTAVNSAKSFKDLQKKLSGMYSQMNDDHFTQRVEKGILLGEVFGKVAHTAKESSVGVKKVSPVISIEGLST